MTCVGAPFVSPHTRHPQHCAPISAAVVAQHCTARRHRALACGQAWHGAAPDVMRQLAWGPGVWRLQPAPHTWLQGCRRSASSPHTFQSTPVPLKSSHCSREASMVGRRGAVPRQVCATPVCVGATPTGPPADLAHLPQPLLVVAGRCCSALEAGAAAGRVRMTTMCVAQRMLRACTHLLQSSGCCP